MFRSIDRGCAEEGQPTVGGIEQGEAVAAGEVASARVSDRKNIFLIGRRRMAGDEDQLTEMLAFLWQEAPELLGRWLDAIGLPVDIGRAAVETQFTIPNGKRPDIAIFSPGSSTLVESKLGSGFGGTQVKDYIEYLGGCEGRRALILLTERPEPVPTDEQRRANEAGVVIRSQRWHDMSDHLAEPGEDSLGGDFVQLLIREGLVKPHPLDSADWKTWNGGFNVLLRLDAFLGELDPLVRQMRRPVKLRSTGGLTKRWIYKLWRGEAIELGFGFGAAPWDTRPHDDPVAFAFVGRQGASDDEAMRAVGVEKGTRSRWTTIEQMNAGCGLTYSWPSLSRWAHELLVADTFEGQVREAAGFLFDTAQYFKSRGYLPQHLDLLRPA